MYKSALNRIVKYKLTAPKSKRMPVLGSSNKRGWPLQKCSLSKISTLIGCFYGAFWRTGLGRICRQKMVRQLCKTSITVLKMRREGFPPPFLRYFFRLKAIAAMSITLCAPALPGTPIFRGP